MSNKALKQGWEPARLGPAMAGTTVYAIVEAARTLLAERGYEALSMRDVAADAGITAAAIYRHFPKKNALIDFVVDDTLREFELLLLRAIAPLPVGSFERLAALGSAYIRIATEHEEHFKVLFSPMRKRPRKLANFPGQCGYQVLRQCVVEAIETGTVRESDPDLVAFFLWSRVHGIAMLLLACDFSDTLPAGVGDLTPEHLFTTTRDFVISGLQAVP
jgi:AcrR family transcriptional regulator